MRRGHLAGLLGFRALASRRTNSGCMGARGWAEERGSLVSGVGGVVRELEVMVVVAQLLLDLRWRSDSGHSRGQARPLLCYVVYSL